MSSLPDFTPHGYQVTEILNNNVQGGRITYQAVEIATQTPVVIKQFRFATQSNWDEYKEIEREIDVLKGLNYQGIPKYLEQFDPSDGLCLVQEYIKAQPLSKLRSFSPEEIKCIAVQVLEILVYLQERIPIVIHRDIKPENVLIGDIPPHSPLKKGGGIKVYLVDFGLARIGNNTMAFSSMMGGTLGFMPPEQVHNQKLTEASDLYGLGATLICLITQTKSADIGSLVDFSTNKITFKDKVPKYSFKFIQWLEKMVEPNPINRFQCAEEALNALKPLYVMRVPEVKLDKLELNFVADKVGQTLSQTITITNDIPETILQGKWSVSPHPSDPPHTPDSHAWIRFSPREFKGNKINCKIVVDTRLLKSDKLYQRDILLESNGKEEIMYLKIKVQTAKVRLHFPIPPYWQIIFTFLFFALLSGIFMQLGLGYVWIQKLILVGIIGLIISNLNIGIDMNMNLERFTEQNKENRLFIAFYGLLGVIYFFVCIVVLIGLALALSIFAFLLIIPMLIVFAIFMNICNSFLLNLLKVLTLMQIAIYSLFHTQFNTKGFNRKTSNIYNLLIIVTSILTGIGAAIGFTPYLLAGLTTSALPLAGMLIYPPIKLMRLKA